MLDLIQFRMMRLKYSLKNSSSSSYKTKILFKRKKNIQIKNSRPLETSVE